MRNLWREIERSTTRSRRRCNTTRSSRSAGWCAARCIGCCRTIRTNSSRAIVSRFRDRRGGRTRSVAGDHREPRRGNATRRSRSARGRGLPPRRRTTDRGSRARRAVVRHHRARARVPPPVPEVGRLYFAVAQELRLDVVREQIEALKVEAAGARWRAQRCAKLSLKSNARCCVACSRSRRPAQATAAHAWLDTNAEAVARVQRASMTC